jgi:hypothetical protein
MAQFYIDDTVLRLYATAESVAECVSAFYHDELNRPMRGRKEPRERASRFLNLCNSIRMLGLTGNVPQKVSSIGAADETRWVTDYRNAWMHGQRKHMEGTGIRYGRKETRAQREVTATGMATITLGFGAGDPHDFTLAEAMDSITWVFESLLELVAACHEALDADLPEGGAGWQRKPADSGMRIGSPNRD